MSDARAEAVEAMAQALDEERGHHYGVRDDAHPGKRCACGYLVPEGEPVRVHTYRAMAERLLSPRVVPCSECGGTGSVASGRVPIEGGKYPGERDAAVSTLCPACNGTGQVSLPPLAVLMGELEQADSVQVNVHSEWGQVTVEELDAAEPLFRLRSGESSPNTEEGT